MNGIALPVLLGLVGLSFVAGVGITAIGPGGVLVTIGLFALTGLSPAQVAGTAIVTHVATGLLGTAVYTRSGQLRAPGTRQIALVLAAAAVVGTPLGVLANGAVDSRAFGVVLGVFVGGVALVVGYRDRAPRRTGRPGPRLIAVVGAGVAAASGLVGVGGPLLAVPILVALGVPPLAAIAAAQVQSVVIAGVGTFGYVAIGAVRWQLAALVGVPELAGVFLGWLVARMLPTRVLTYALVASLAGLAPYLALHG